MITLSGGTYPFDLAIFPIKELMLVITFILYIHEYFLTRYSTCFKIFVLLILVVIGIGQFLGLLCFTNTYVKSVVFFFKLDYLYRVFFKGQIGVARLTPSLFNDLGTDVLFVRVHESREKRKTTIKHTNSLKGNA